MNEYMFGTSVLCWCKRGLWEGTAEIWVMDTPTEGRNGNVRKGVEG